MKSQTALMYAVRLLVMLPAYARRAIPAPTTPIRRPPWTKRLPAPEPVTVAAGADVVVGLTSIMVV